MIARASFIAAVFAAAHLGTALPAAAEEPSANVHEAARHFQRGVTLYGETDYRGALVEFTRAYALSPNLVVLYNIGETDYQLRDYAGALTTFEHYLAAADAADPRRAELESSVRELRTRVGRLSFTSVPAGVEIAVDDRAVGTTPIDAPVIVSVGRVKIAATAPGRPPVTKYLDVAAEDNVAVALDLAAAPADTSSDASSAVVSLASPGAADAGSRARGVPWRTVGWIATGVSAAGAIGCGIVARKEAADLKTDRDTFPTSASTLDHKSGVTTTFAVLADSMAAAALVVGGLTLYSTLSARPDAGSTRVTAGLASIDVTVTF